MSKQETIDWLLNSDPVVQFQTKRDILDLPKKEWKPDQEMIPKKGWGKKLLDVQDEIGTWAGNLYVPKFISTHYTLLLLRRFEMLPNDQTTKGCSQLIRLKAIGMSPHSEINQCCITGMGLGILAHFHQQEKFFDNILEYLTRYKMKDGAWNCRNPRDNPTHSSVNTTLSVLEGLAYLDKNYPQYHKKIEELRDSAHEFLLKHELFKSHTTGKIIASRYADIGFPPRWRYNILSALDYFQMIGLDYDSRMKDAINIIKKKENNGKWSQGKPIQGQKFFSLDSGRGSSFNTLRALRVLKKYDK